MFFTCSSRVPHQCQIIPNLIMNKLLVSHYKYDSICYYYTLFFCLFYIMTESVKFIDFSDAEIWQHYLRSTCGKLEQCKICKSVLKCHGGSTKVLHVHIKSTHHIEIKRKRKNPDAPDSGNESQAKCTMITTINHFVKESTLPEVLARMTAYDGLTFNFFVMSQDLRKSLKALGQCFSTGMGYFLTVTTI